MVKVGFHYRSEYKGHVMTEDHVECPERLDSIVEHLEESKLMKKLVPLEALSSPVGEELVRDVHQEPYISKVKRVCGKGGGKLDQGDTIANEHSYDIAIQAVEGVAGCAKAILDGKVQRAFAAVRPPGHHAVEGSAMGFCIFNNVATAARYIQMNSEIKKIAIVDFDVHHGNGTQDIFYEDGSVLFFSTHQFPFFPGTGAPGETGIGDGRGLTINCPLTEGSRGSDVLAAMESKLLPALKKFQPEILLVSAGFDAHKEDPVGGLLLLDDDYVKISKMLVEISNQYCEGRLLSVLEGGYNLDTLGHLVGIHLQALLED